MQLTWFWAGSNSGSVPHAPSCAVISARRRPSRASAPEEALNRTDNISLSVTTTNSVATTAIRNNSKHPNYTTCPRCGIHNTSRSHIVFSWFARPPRLANDHMFEHLGNGLRSPLTPTSFLARGFDVPRCRACQARQAVQISRRLHVQEARTTGGTVETTEKWLLLERK